jgi:hypothetical protein
VFIRSIAAAFQISPGLRLVSLGGSCYAEVCTTASTLKVQSILLIIKARCVPYLYPRGIAGKDSSKLSNLA